MRRKKKGKIWGHRKKLRNRLLSKKIFVAERTFGTMKRVYGMSRAKVLSEGIFKAIVYNLKRGSAGINMYAA